MNYFSQIVSHLRAAEPLIYFGISGGDFDRARRIISDAAKAALAEPVMVDFAFGMGFTDNSRDHRFENSRNSVGTDIYAFLRWIRAFFNDPRADSFNYGVFTIEAVDFLIRSESRGIDPILVQTIAELRSSTGCRGTLFLCGNTVPSCGLPYTLADIPRITVGPPDENEIRSHYLEHLVKTGQLEEKLVSECAQALLGAQSKEIENILSRAVVDFPKIETDFCRKERNKALAVRLGGALEPIEPELKLEQVPGISREYLDFIYLRKAHLYSSESKNRQRAKGILITGAFTGVGKTFLARATLGSLGCPAFKLTLPLLLDSYVGESERILQETLSTLTSLAGNGCIGLYADEVEKFFGSAQCDAALEGGSSGVTRRLLSIFLQFLAETKLPIFTILIAGSLAIPQELIRRGRLDRIVFLGPWSPDAQREILNHYLRLLEMEFNPEECREAILNTDSFSPAEIRSAIEEIALEHSVKRDRAVTLFEIRKALSRISPITQLIGEESIDSLTQDAGRLNFLIANMNVSADEAEDRENSEPIKLIK